MTTVSDDDVTDFVERVWFTTREAADHCRRHPVTIRKAAANGSLRSAQGGSGRGRRYRLEWLDEWMAKR